ncbi:hypothetical protein L345_16629, partial [Ophiophagus hannah]
MLLWVGGKPFARPSSPPPPPHPPAGLTSEGIYRKSGQNSKITSLLETLRRDARKVRLKEEDYQVDDVANTLKRIQCFSDENQMTTHNLAIVFGPTLFQTDGKDFKAGQVVEDLIRCYMEIFSVGLAKNGVGRWAWPDWVGSDTPCGDLSWPFFMGSGDTVPFFGCLPSPPSIAQSHKPEKEWLVKNLKIYLGIKKKVRPPTCWGFTVFFENEKMEKQQ